MRSLYLPLIIMLAFPATAEVISKDKHGFALKIERVVSAPAEAAYDQFIQIGQWWHNDHTWFGDASKMFIEEKVNGCFCEINNEQQALHMTVSYIDPGKEIRLIGGLGPLQMLGVQGGMSWTFTPTDNEKTKIVLSYQVTGFMDGGLDKLADIVNQVQSQQMDNLIAKLNLP